MICLELTRRVPTRKALVPFSDNTFLAMAYCPIGEVIILLHKEICYGDLINLKHIN